MDYNELFGLEAEERAEDQEVAEPETEEPETEETAQPEEKTEENARYAAARRKAEAERDAALKEAKEKHAAEVKGIFAGLGLVNPYTEKPVTSKEELDEYLKATAEAKMAKIARSSNMSKEQFRQFVEELPQVREAKEAVRRAQEEQSRALVDQQLKEIQKLDPEIKTLEDLARTENYEKVYALVKRGYDIADAYIVANRDSLGSKSAAAASRQAAINAAGKEHLSRTAQRGQGAVSVPKEVVQQYRMMDPNITEAEIQKHYASYLKR